MVKTQRDCFCGPCIARELETHEWYIIEHTPIDAKIDGYHVEEFRRLVSIAPDLTFAEKMVELEAFSASTAAQQRELIHRFALDARESAVEMCIAASSELDELDDLIGATEPQSIPLAQVVALVRSA